MSDWQAFDDACARALRGEEAGWVDEWAETQGVEAIVRRVHYHGIAGALNERIELLIDWPAQIIDIIERESVSRAMWELRHRSLIVQVIEALHREGIRSVVLKGTAYAYSLYSAPSLRFRGDTDLLIAEADQAAASSALKNLGWVRAMGEPGPFGSVHYQEIWQFTDPAGLTHDIDLHWEVTNSKALGHVLAAEKVSASALPLNRLSPHALRAESVTALIHRAINRATHAQSGYFSMDRNEYDPNRLCWALDIHLIAQSLSREEWRELSRRAINDGVAAIVCDALSFAAARLHTPLPQDVMADLSSAPTDTPALRFLSSNNSLDKALANLKATPGLLARAKLLLAFAFPSASHMRDKYSGQSNTPLWGLYLRRLLDGVLRIFGRSQP